MCSNSLRLPAPGLSRRLNPFDIRACVQTERTGVQLELLRLNPFDIRACVQTPGQERPAEVLRVLIPLISGHVFKLASDTRRRTGIGLNPFDIRACVQTAQLGEVGGGGFCLNPFDIRACVQTHHPTVVCRKSCRLNPFDIRACVQTEDPGIPARRFVLIPLISGHVFKRIQRASRAHPGRS